LEPNHDLASLPSTYKQYRVRKFLVIDRDYLARHAALLLKLAKSTKDRSVAIALIDKAAELQERIEESDLADAVPLAPDMEPLRAKSKKS
jgi:hypothetical protein